MEIGIAKFNWTIAHVSIDFNQHRINDANAWIAGGRYGCGVVNFILIAAHKGSVKTCARSIAISALTIAPLAGCGGEEPSERQARPMKSSVGAHSAPTNAVALTPHPQNREPSASVITRSLGGRAYTIINPGETPDGDAESAVRALSPAALAGDASASYGIYLKIRDCASMMRRFDERGAAAVDSGTYESCRNLSAESYDAAASWLDRAATHGHLGAQLLYVADPEATLGTPADMLRYPDAIKSYKEKSMTYLKNASVDGNVDALIRLADAYRLGVLTEKGHTLAYAYYQAVERIEPRFVSREKMEAIEKQLSQQEVKFSRTKGMRIYDECCSQQATP
ncbi:hypothetical protein [Stenotrophomonas sp. AB1(2024)]|uniref:hypothetical protein n=1 Tax=Stenotrophomonas sp. AB1(2024) TaxID=3132215 RepID=UPI0030997AB7